MCDTVCFNSGVCLNSAVWLHCLRSAFCLHSTFFCVAVCLNSTASRKERRHLIAECEQTAASKQRTQWKHEWKWISLLTVNCRDPNGCKLILQMTNYFYICYLIFTDVIDFYRCKLIHGCKKKYGCKILLRFWFYGCIHVGCLMYSCKWMYSCKRMIQL